MSAPRTAPRAMPGSTTVEVGKPNRNEPPVDDRY